MTKKDLAISSLCFTKTHSAAKNSELYYILLGGKIQHHQQASIPPSILLTNKKLDFCSVFVFLFTTLVKILIDILRENQHRNSKPHFKEQGLRNGQRI